MPEQNPDELGALWEHESARGLYMTGTIDGVKVVIFKNGKKTTDKQPDWRVLKSKPKPEADERPRAAVHAGPLTDEDIPF